MARLTLKQVNKHIQTKYPDIFVQRIDGYFSVWSDDDATQLKISSLFSSGIYFTPTVNSLSLEKWMESVEYVIEDTQRSPSEREPLYPAKL